MSKFDEILAVTPLVFEDLPLDSAATSGTSTPTSVSALLRPSVPQKDGRDAWPFLNAVLFVGVASAILGGIGVGVGQTVDSELGSVRSWRYEFWWGGVLVS